jgi:SAM-dependent methyltransferase
MPNLRPVLACIALASSAALAQEDVPFITTPDAVTLAMLQAANVGPADHVIDLGSGDGRIVISAARRFGASGLGVEIVADLVRKSRDNARLAGVAERVRFSEQDLFATDLRPATVVTMYLLPAVNLQLRPRLLALAPGTRIVSHDWDMGDWAPDRTQTLDVPDKSIGREKLSRVHLWIVPAQVGGLWCAEGGSLEVTQRFQAFSATLNGLHGQAPVIVFDGRIEGTRLRTTGPLPTALTARGDTLEFDSIDPAAQLFAGRRFKRAAHGSCAGL